MWDALEKTLGYSFRSRALLEEALTHPSLRIHDRNRADYERLEFLGDAVLGLVIAKLIYSNYPGEREGELARRHAALVCGLATTQVARELELGRFLLMADGEQSSGGRENGANLEDACEALMGAVYLDGGLEAVEKIILRYWTPMADSLIEPPKDPKSALQEWAQGSGKPLPVYSLMSREGPDHALQFEVRVEVEGGQTATGSGSSKRAAEREAAEKLLELIKK